MHTGFMYDVSMTPNASARGNIIPGSFLRGMLREDISGDGSDISQLFKVYQAVNTILSDSFVDGNRSRMISYSAPRHATRALKA